MDPEWATPYVAPAPASAIPLEEERSDRDLYGPDDSAPRAPAASDPWLANEATQGTADHHVSDHHSPFELSGAPWLPPEYGHPSLVENERQPSEEGVSLGELAGDESRRIDPSEWDAFSWGDPAAAGEHFAGDAHETPREEVNNPDSDSTAGWWVEPSENRHAEAMERAAAYDDDATASAPQVTDDDRTWLSELARQPTPEALRSWPHYDSAEDGFAAEIAPASEPAWQGEAGDDEANRPTPVFTSAIPEMPVDAHLSSTIEYELASLVAADADRAEWRDDPRVVGVIRSAMLEGRAARLGAALEAIARRIREGDIDVRTIDPDARDEALLAALLALLLNPPPT